MTPLCLALMACLAGVAYATNLWDPVSSANDFYLVKRSHKKLGGQCVYAHILQRNTNQHTYKFEGGYRNSTGHWFKGEYWVKVLDSEKGALSRAIMSTTEGSTTGQRADLVYSDGDKCTIMTEYDRKDFNKPLGCNV